MRHFSSSPPRPPSRCGPGFRRRATAQLRSCAKGGPHWRLGAPLNMEPESASPLRLPLRRWLRLSLPLSLRGSTSPKGGQSPSQRRLRRWRFADIPTAPPGQSIVAVLVVTLSIFSASLALDACAIASALAPQRFPITSATEIALLLVTPLPQSMTGSALASQRFAVWRSA